MNTQRKASLHEVPGSPLTKSGKKTVVVGMSGGVDSSLAAALLKEQGYAVIGVYMKNWSVPIKGVEHCPWIQDQLDARQVAHQLGIPFYTVNFEAQYKKLVIDTFFADYSAGRTPNPDVLCNRFIKFDAFYRYAKSLGADYIATGHYARISNGVLKKGLDSRKDQSYFLWAIDKSVLPDVLFPLGELTKSQVRVEANKRGLVTAGKRDSQGICFIGQADVRDFLAAHLKPEPGPVVTKSSEQVGTHQGAQFYTIGQRAGIADLAWGDTTRRPILYVLDLDVRTNTVVVGEDGELYASKLRASSLSWLGEPSVPGQALSAKIRYGQSDMACVMLESSNDSFVVEFFEPQRAITPGQSVVLYDGDKVLGGGIIEAALAPVLAASNQRQDSKKGDSSWRNPSQTKNRLTIS